MSTLEFELPLRYGAVTVFQDDLICAAEGESSDYGDGSVMLIKMNKFTPNDDTAGLIKDHLTNTPSILRVMHGGLQATGQWRTFLNTSF